MTDDPLTQRRRLLGLLSSGIPENEWEDWQRANLALEQHRLRWRMNGFPVYDGYDENDDAIEVGVIEEPQWRWADLDVHQRWHVWQSVDQIAAVWRRDGRSEDLIDRLFALTLDDFGVDCPHFEQRRMYRWHDKGKTFECQDCHAWIVQPKSALDTWDDERRRKGEFVPLRDLVCRYCGADMALHHTDGLKPSSPSTFFPEPLPTTLTADCMRTAVYRCPFGHEWREAIPYWQSVAA